MSAATLTRLMVLEEWSPNSLRDLSTDGKHYSLNGCRLVVVDWMRDDNFGVYG